MKTTLTTVIKNLLRIRDGFLDEAKRLEKEISDVNVDSNGAEAQRAYLSGQKEAYERAAHKVAWELDLHEWEKVYA